MWFVQVILHIESNGHSISMGRTDQYLYPFMKKDINDGLINKEQVHELIGCFFIKVFSNNKLRSESTTRTQLGYPTYQNICLGGQTIDGKDATNSLTDI
ncbi:MAG: formate C-acetyltransferase/glycerol dehydratase family glycyl radical enzyme, partial [Firmicutes bacterium]|nr:formate C-acetyltransferase/glycerol dehydratase family glycyl radical enzyme [Bacillota bacterium]